jgi:hypothetical protein
MNMYHIYEVAQNLLPKNRQLDIGRNSLYYAGQKFWPSLSVNSKKNCNPYFIVVLIMNVIFWVVNFKTQNYFVISTTQNVYLRLSMYDCSNFVHSCRIFGISELQTV